jgi:hypothetical protein
MEALMRRGKRLLVLGGLWLIAGLIVVPAFGAPDPDRNKNAILVDLDCGGAKVVASGILQSHSPTFLVIYSETPAIKGGSAGTTFGYDLWDNPGRTGAPIASFRQPGFFGTNNHELTACDFTLPNFVGWFTGYFMFTPRGA